MADADSPMNPSLLMLRLLQIERSIGKVSTISLRSMVLDAERSALDIERQIIDTLCENEHLRERLENCPSLSRLRPSPKEAPPAPAPHQPRLPS